MKNRDNANHAPTLHASDENLTDNLPATEEQPLTEQASGDTTEIVEGTEITEPVTE